MTGRAGAMPALRPARAALVMHGFLDRRSPVVGRTAQWVAVLLDRLAAVLSVVAVRLVLAVRQELLAVRQELVVVRQGPVVGAAALAGMPGPSGVRRATRLLSGRVFPGSRAGLRHRHLRMTSYPPTWIALLGVG